MTTRLHLLVEGRTEFNFVNQVLRPHFASSDSLFISVSMLTTKRDHVRGRKYSGGSSTYSKLRGEIKLFLYDKSPDFRLSTMVDLYGFPDGFDTYSSKSSAPYERIALLEASMAKDIGDERFIPYVQLHEYESLILSDPEKFREIYTNFGQGIDRLVQLSKSKPPEEINDGSNTAPSKRIISSIPRYEFEKSSVGPTVALHIGLNNIRDRCPHFSHWVEKLEGLS